MSNTVVHFEIPADDVDKLKELYTGVFGWKTVEVPEYKDRVIFQTVPTDEKGMLLEPGLNGGLYKRGSEGRVPLNYIRVGSVDEHIDKAVKAGGKLLAPKWNIPAVGDIAWVADPEGDPVGLIRPERTWAGGQMPALKS